MKVLFLTNNKNTAPLVKFLRKKAEEEVVVCANPVSGGTLEDISPDIVISYNYKHIIRQEAIDAMSGRIINLHISYLPMNRGYDPNFWSFMNNTKKGFTVHLVDAGINTGDVLMQHDLRFNEKEETLMTSYKQLHKAMLKSFAFNWKRIRGFDLIALPQRGPSSLHYNTALLKVKEHFGNELWTTPISELKKQIIELKLLES